MSAEDAQRAAALFAHFGSQIHRSRKADHKALLSNTLDKFLPPKSSLELRFEDLQPANLNGMGGGNRITLNRARTPAGLEPLRTSVPPIVAEAHIVDTLVHEVNHVLNGDVVAPTFEYFMGEYRAWYVGYSARTGAPPDAQRAYDQANMLITSTEPGSTYRHIASALAADGDEAKRIRAFMAKFKAQNHEVPSNILAPRPSPEGNLLNR